MVDMNSKMPTVEQNAQAMREMREADHNIEGQAFQRKLFSAWYDNTFPLGGGDHVEALYAAWLAGYQTGYDHAY